MISKLITFYRNGFVTERELNKLALIAILEENLIDNNKYTELK